MRNTVLTFILLFSFPVCRAQNLTRSQKEADFRHLVNLYSTYYAPMEWKKQLFHFDGLAIQPWLDRVSQTTTDLDFYEICVDYVNSLNDTHVSFVLPSDFSVTLGLTADIYDGILLIDSINRTLLPLNKYPFVIGDELLSVDGTDIQQLVKDISKYTAQGNPISTRRQAAQRVTTRAQSRFPHAVDYLGNSAFVVVRRQNGDIENYTMPWVATGTPLEVGPIPSPRARAVQGPVSDPSEPDYMAELRKAQWSGILNPSEDGVNGYGARNPIFVNALPNFNFTRRMGGVAADFYYSGSFKYEELTIGYIRIPNYAPPSMPTALMQFEQEIAFMKANTNGLIVDDMRNTGGNLCFGEDIAARLIPYQFRATGFRLRPFWSRINGFYTSLVNARANGASQQIVDQYEVMFRAMLAANQQGQNVTDSLPICTSSLTREAVLDRNGIPVAYDKTLMVLIDEFSTSTADSVPGMIQDAGRGVLYGMRTNGAGGNNTSFRTGSYSEGTAGMTLALQTRKQHVDVGGYPFTDYIENVGVWPDIQDDYMTKANLLGSGAPFVSGFLQHMAAEIRARK